MYLFRCTPVGLSGGGCKWSYCLLNTHLSEQEPYTFASLCTWNWGGERGYAPQLLQLKCQAVPLQVFYCPGPSWRGRFEQSFPAHPGSPWTAGRIQSPDGELSTKRLLPPCLPHDSSLAWRQARRWPHHLDSHRWARQGAQVLTLQVSGKGSGPKKDCKPHNLAFVTKHHELIKNTCRNG